MRPLEITVAICVGAALSAVLVPKLIQANTEGLQIQSLEAITNAGRGLLLAENDLGKIPREDWESYARAYSKNNIDPALAKTKNPTENTGWGLNLRTGLAQGKAITRTEDVHSKELPPDTVLLMASDGQTITPNRDGTLQQSGPNDPRRRHGNQSPYFLANGTASLLPDNEGRNLLKLRTLPPSKVVAIAQNKEEHKIEEEWAKKKAGQAIYSGYIVLEDGEVKTPAIPLRGISPEISFEVSSKNEGHILSQIVYLNEEGREINYDVNQPSIKAKTLVDLKNNDPLNYTDNMIKGDTLGFNAHKGHAEIIPEANYQKGGSIVKTKETRELERAKTKTTTTTITRIPKNIPDGAVAIRLIIGTIKTQRPNETTIKNIKATVAE